MNAGKNNMFHSDITPSTIRDILFYAKKEKNILFVGICGSGMASLARLLKREGYHILGYDSSSGGEYARLLRDGIEVVHSVEEIDILTVALTVYTLAIPDIHPLISEEIPHCSRAQLLGAWMLDYPIRIAIAGAHGKSTVTSLVHRTLLALGERPTTLSGADLGDGEGPLFVGEKNIFLYECCEYKNSFLYTYPTVALLLNIDLEHTDFFKSIDEIREAFLRFSYLANSTLYFATDEGLSSISERMPTSATPYFLFRESTAPDREHLTFGEIEGKERDVYTYSFYREGRKMATLTPKIFGEVGVYNTLATLTLMAHLGYHIQKCAECLQSLGPIGRRMELLGFLGARPLYYDFAHHPTEILMTITTLTDRYGIPPVVIFAPHTYSRTRDLWEKFVEVFVLAKEVYLAPITSAREEPLPNITSEYLAQDIGTHAHPLSCLDTKTLENCEGPIVLMGAGTLEGTKEKLTKMQTFISICEI